MQAMDYLRGGLPGDLLLLDLVEGALERGGANGPVHGMGVWEGADLRGVGLLYPSVLMDSRVQGAAIEALCGSIEALRGGLLKSCELQVEAVWRRLQAAGRRSILDRMESGLLVRESGRQGVDRPFGHRLRPAVERDLGALVEMAGASLRAEGRPDPREVAPDGFRRWVQGRLSRARVLEIDGEVAFVGYADVRRAEGWLIQGVYTVPHRRRQGLAVAGMSGLLDEAFEAGADHVQLTVIDQNQPALRLYAGLGFRPYSRVRTILFS